ncbi:ATP-binding protein [Flavobacterium soli]|uniref:ATP-binding protein n=1 Tax=Flavobacterium soli TaxID=344881 RepID=UPI00040A5D05|nr:ATP-binding protein [Flavobacterium soli]
MKLVSIKLRNFRIYQDELTINLGDLNCIIGKNDIGKSTILEAINIFFNDGIEKTDLSVNSNDDLIEITCLFDDFREKLVLDSTVETSLKEESLLNQNGLLEIKKTFKIGGAITKATYIIAEHEIHEKLLYILTLKNSPLKALAAELEIDLAGINKTKNPPIRKAIKENLQSQKQLIELKVDGSLDTENNLKAVWSKLKDYLPIFTLFKVDKTINDKDKDVQDPMNQAIKETLAIPEIKELLDKIEVEIKAKSTIVAEQTLEKLKEIDASLAEKMKSDFSKLPSWDKIFDLTLLNENNVPLNKRGSGVKRLVLLSFFQAQAEKKKIETSAPSIIYAIEEPETAQHPNHQKILINSLIKLSERSNIQVFFTTHSANLVREIPMESLIYIYKSIENQNVVEYGVDIETQELNEETINRIIDTLGVLPNPADKISKLLFVEGNHDVNALKRYSKLLNTYNHAIIPLDERQDIAIVISGGSCLKFYIDNKYLDGLGKPELHIYDNDIPDYRDYVDKINQQENKKGFNTTKTELENYLTKEAIEESYAMNGLIIVVPEITDEMDVPLIVAQTLQNASNGRMWEELNDEDKKKKESKCKKHLNTIAVEKMTIERLTHRNGLDEISEWLLNLN